ncbi:hypothetical protein LTS10_009543 [Elasticomyces elasticus]|nr:hypothetical protein LTS10_009543 [Elasticomyces elasticus]
MDDGQASDGGFTETDGNNSIMTPASDGTETTQTPTVAAHANTTAAAQSVTAQSSSLESQVHDLFTITNNLREQLTAQTQANEQLKAELATTRAELARRLAVQDSFAERLKLQPQASEAQQDHIRTLKELIAPTDKAARPSVQQQDAASPAVDSQERPPQGAQSTTQGDMADVYRMLGTLLDRLLKVESTKLSMSELFGVMGSMINATYGKSTDGFEAKKLEKINAYVKDWDAVMGDLATDNARKTFRTEMEQYLSLNTQNVTWFVRKVGVALSDVLVAALRKQQVTTSAADMDALFETFKTRGAPTTTNAQEPGGTSNTNTKPETPTSASNTSLPRHSDAKSHASVIDSNQDPCPHCKSSIAHLSIGPCNHAVCHICVLRGRALYKSNACPTCKADMSTVVFTDDAEKKFDEYSWSDYFRSDPTLGIHYTNEEIFIDSVMLLRYNCPDESCDFACMGWPDLHKHVRTAHFKVMCDICTRNNKVFTHEHELFTEQDVREHVKYGDGPEFRGHPQCGLCKTRFFGADELKAHIVKKHEQCMLCEENVAVFLSKADLDEHMESEHNTITIPVMQQETLQKARFPGPGVSLSYPAGTNPNQSLRMHVYDKVFLLQFRDVCNSQPSEDLCRRITDIREELAAGNALPAMRAYREIHADKHSRVKGMGLADSMEKQKTKALCRNGFRGV